MQPVGALIRRYKLWGQPEPNCGHDLWEYLQKRGEATTTTEAVEYSMGDKYLQETFPGPLLLHNMNQRTNGDSWEKRRVASGPVDVWIHSRNRHRKTGEDEAL